MPKRNDMARTITVSSGQSLCGTISVPGDKSISHRSLFFGAIAEGITMVSNFLKAEDTLSTVQCLRSMGVSIEMHDTVVVHGMGLQGLHQPSEVLWMGNSGTTTRLLLGILAGQPFAATLDGDASLRRRPMDRVAIPLQQMGAAISGQGTRCTLPITIQGGPLQALVYTSPVASAQVKTALLLAGLYADGCTSVREPAKSRDHTERMLRGFGVDVLVEGLTVRLCGGQHLQGQQIAIPGDISSAAFFLVAGAIVPGSHITIQHVGINPTRNGIIEVLLAMGALLTISNERLEGGEPVADISISHSRLTGTTICGGMIPRLIDEIPILAVAAAFAEGETIIADAAELRVKESDRIATVGGFLREMGAIIEDRTDGMRITGSTPRHGITVDSQGDHRVAMSAAIASIAAGVTSHIHGAESVATSFPSFTRLLRKLGASINEIEE